MTPWKWMIRYHHNNNYYHNEHNQGLGLKTCSFKAQSVICLSIFVSVFPYPAVSVVGTVSHCCGHYPLIPSLSSFWLMLGFLDRLPGQVQWWGCHLKPPDRLVGHILVWSLPFDLICFVIPARGLSPLRHHCHYHRDTQALSPRQG
jgi:hypothetical protein